MSDLWPQDAKMRWPKIRDSDVALSDLGEWIMDNVLAARLVLYPVYYWIVCEGSPF